MIDHFTGTLSVNVVLDTLKSRDLVVPISLNYKATGNKVESVDGPDGLAWQMNAGGWVTRVVKGYPDEMSNYPLDSNIKGFLHKEWPFRRRFIGTRKKQ